MNPTTTNNDGCLSDDKEESNKILKLGLDVHARQITFCVQVDGLKPQPPQKMPWEKLLRWIERQIKQGAKVFSCYEAGPCGYGLHRKLQAMGVSNIVVAPQRWNQDGHRVKTDKRDAQELVDRLDRYLRGNKNVFSVVRVPSEQEEQRRSLARQRGRLLKERNRCVCRGFGMMLAQGCHAPSNWWKPENWKQ